MRAPRSPHHAHRTLTHEDRSRSVGRRTHLPRLRLRLGADASGRLANPMTPRAPQTACARPDSPGTSSMQSHARWCSDVDAKLDGSMRRPRRMRRTASSVTQSARTRAVCRGRQAARLACTARLPTSALLAGKGTALDPLAVLRAVLRERGDVQRRVHLELEDVIELARNAHHRRCASISRCVNMATADDSRCS